jgi:hypothetical protein
MNEMTNQNENQNTETENQTSLQVIERETEDYVIMKNEEGKFVRKAKFHDYSSITAETREEKIWLLGLMQADEESGTGLKDCVGKQIVVENIITRRYDKINEDSGQTEYGVLTYLITPEKQAFVTSSKNVYFSIVQIMDLFGKPTDETWENITVKVLKEKATNGDMIKIKMIG